MGYRGKLLPLIAQLASSALRSVPRVSVAYHTDLVEPLFGAAQM